MGKKEILKQYSRDLRNNSTYGEIILWSKVLRAKKMYGYQFNRQFVIQISPLEKGARGIEKSQNIIVDFICRKLKLIIEVDGYSHNFKSEEDKKRDKKLEEMGFAVLRFTEFDVNKNLNNVIRAIESFISETEQSTQPPLPKGE